MRIFDFENYSGTFGTVNFSGLLVDQTATFDSLMEIVTITSVPEPGAFLLGCFGALALCTAAVETGIYRPRRVDFR